MRKIATIVLFVCALAPALLATPPNPNAPEISPAEGMNAIALLAGAVMLRARPKR